METKNPALQPLAEQIGVTAESLARLGVTSNGSEYHIPERNADGEVIGIARRFDDGNKGFVAGGHRGLTMPWLLLVKNDVAEPLPPRSTKTQTWSPHIPTHIVNRAWDHAKRLTKETGAPALSRKPESNGPFPVNRAVKELKLLLAQIEKEPLSPVAATIYEWLRELPEHRAMTTGDILEELARRGIDVCESTFYERYVPELKAWGVQNKPRIGYFISIND